MNFIADDQARVDEDDKTYQRRFKILERVGWLLEWWKERWRGRSHHHIDPMSDAEWRMRRIWREGQP